MLKVEESARKSNMTIAEFITDAVEKYEPKHSSGKWPDGFENLFGSITDETFRRHPEISFSLDTKRETL
jgi:hypothetical protein